MGSNETNEVLSVFPSRFSLICELRRGRAARDQRDGGGGLWRRLKRKPPSPAMRQSNSQLAPTVRTKRFPINLFPARPMNFGSNWRVAEPAEARASLRQLVIPLLPSTGFFVNWDTQSENSFITHNSKTDYYFFSSYPCFYPF